MKLTARLSPVLLAASLVGCDTGPTPSGPLGPGPSDPCDFSALDIFDAGAARDAIPALTNPIMTGPGQKGAHRDRHRVRHDPGSAGRPELCPTAVADCVAPAVTVFMVEGRLLPGEGFVNALP